MNSTPNTQHSKLIQHWLTLGPFYEDVSATVEGLTLFEGAGSQVGRTLIDALAEEARAVLANDVYESASASIRGHSGRWEMLRRPEPFLAWGHYYISNHLGFVLLSTLVRSDHAGSQRCHLTMGLPLRAIVFLDGIQVFDSFEHEPERSFNRLMYSFDISLSDVEQRLSVALMRVGRFAQVGMRLQILHAEVDVRVPPSPHVHANTRTAIEQELTGLRLERDLFRPEHQITLYNDMQAAAVPLRISLRGPEQPRIYGNDPLQLGPDEGRCYGSTPFLVEAGQRSIIPICLASDLKDGSYIIVCEWLDEQQNVITSTHFDIRKLAPLAPLPGKERAEDRRQAALDFLAYAQDWHPSPPVWAQLARYALGHYHEVDEGMLVELCAFLHAHKDCSDFAIQGLLRLLVWEQRERKLSPGINALMKQTVLGFKYWVDEPGDTVMYMGSENHRLLFHVAEWLAGQLYPTEEFSNSKQRGLFHALKGRMFITEWIRQRGRFGFDEWHSNAYYPICIAPLLNVYDFAIAEDYKLKQMAGALLDVMLFNLAADSFQGIFGTTHGRSYALFCKHAELDDTASASWLLWGSGTLASGSFGMATVSLATSSYRPPAIFDDIANDNTAIVESRQRAGVLPGTPPHANFIVFRTPDYSISCTQDYRKGEFESSTHIAQISMSHQIGIFWSCPHTSGEGAGLRPDYWSGNVTLPRVIQHRQVIALHWQLHEFAWMTHCLFEPGRFDEVRLDALDQGWAFGRAGNGLVAIFASGGLRLGRGGQYAGRELICDARQVTWLAECGRISDWDSLDDFAAAIRAAALECDGDTISYASPSIGHFVSGWDRLPTLNGQPLQLTGYPLIDSPWASSRFGSGEFIIRYGGEEREIWLGQ